MKRFFFAATAVALLGGAPVVAQSTLSVTPGMVTSPLGILGTTAPTASAGIPLGSTELDSPGLSPVPSDSVTCPSTTPTNTTGTSNVLPTFDGGGVGGTSTSSACPTTASAPSTNTASGATSSSGGSIPLGAAEIDSAGVAPIPATPSMNSMSTTTTPLPSVTPAPAPSLTTTPCSPGSTTVTTSATSSGSSTC